MDDFERVRAETRAAADAAADPSALEAVRVAALGRRGAVTELMKHLGSLDPEARRAYGAKVNALKDELTARGVKVSHNTVWLFLRREGLRFKKNTVRH